MRTYGTNLPNSLTSVGPDRPWLSPPQEPVSDLGTDTVLAVSRAPGWTELPCCAVRPLRAVTASTGFDASTGRSPARLTLRRRLSLYGGTGILTRFPFDQLELRLVLGPANPQLTNSAEEPFPVRPSGFLPDYRCYYGQDYRHRSVHTSSHPYFRPNGAPIY